MLHPRRGLEHADAVAFGVDDAAIEANAGDVVGNARRLAAKDFAACFCDLFHTRLDVLDGNHHTQCLVGLRPLE